MTTKALWVSLVTLTGCQGSPAPEVGRVEQAIDANLTFGGGPVIPHAQIALVFWNDQVQFQWGLPGFYSTIVNSSYLDWLFEYPSNGQYMGRGNLVQTVVDPAPPAATFLADVDVENELTRLINAGILVAPGANTLYMVHMPPGVVVWHQNLTSCNDPGNGWWCGYHGWFNWNGTVGYYGVLADMAPCGGQCGPSDAFGNTTATASHEMLEAITDPQGNAWRDGQQGEIADICQNLYTQSNGYTVTRAWSNAQYNCVVKNPCFECPGGTSCKCGDFVCRPANSYCP